MPILAADTTSEFGSIALLDGNRLIEEAALRAPDGFGAVIFDALIDLLKRHNVKLDQVDLFAAASGPGSFTGVRVGLTAMKGLAEFLRKPVAAVSNLAALADCCEGDLRAPVIDARRGEVYAAIYDSELRLIQPEMVTSFEQWLAGAPDGLTFVSPDFSVFRPLLAGTPHANAVIVDGVHALAASIGRIAARHGGANPAAIDANYVRRSDAELLWKDLP